ncbi:hypothetical protein PS2_042661 [Malus domestica]
MRYNLDNEIKAILRGMISKKEQATMEMVKHTQNTTNVGGISKSQLGFEFVVLTMFLHYCPIYWGENIDEFNPEKFAEGAHLPENQYRRAFHPSCCGRFVFPTLILHTDPKYRGGDVEEFKPERFAEGVAHGFSVIKAKMAPVMILQHFTVELSPSYIHCPVMYITVQPHHGTPVIQHRI